jgi:hypothetical protein
VDSENLFYHIEQKGLEDAISQLGGGNNAWALVWWDKLNETLNFLRNKERTLYYCWEDNGDCLYWASESWMLIAALARHDVKHGTPTLFTEDMHYCLHVDDKGNIDKPVLRKVAAPPSFTTPTISTHTSKIITLGTKGSSGQTTKKEEEVGSCLDNVYLNSKGVVFEVLNVNTDNNGSEYLLLFDRKHPYKQVRCYIRRQDEWFKDLIGEDIRGDVTGWNSHDRGFYKISPHTVEKVAPLETLYVTHTGKVITEKAWEKMYNSCGYCSTPLFAKESNKFTNVGECFCPDCSSNPEVTQYVNFINV